MSFRFIIYKTMTSKNLLAIVKPEHYYCKSLGTKASAKCPKCKCNVLNSG